MATVATTVALHSMLGKTCLAQLVRSLPWTDLCDFLSA